MKTGMKTGMKAGMNPHPKRGCCRRLRISEDNARFLLLGVVLIIYLLSGALLFQFLEQDEEVRMRKRYWEAYDHFLSRFEQNQASMSDVEVLMEAYSQAKVSGMLNGTRPRWDFLGSFHFVATIVSTIGYGATTPQSNVGKVAVMFYGFLGCSGGILFFNLFLERIITFLAFLLRTYHVRELRKFRSRRVSVSFSNNPGSGDKRRASQDSVLETEDSLENWKPSVYWVMVCLLGIALVIATGVSAMYSPLEGWTYLESIYFCFVTFATIGFGDFVSAQKPEYPNEAFYHMGNFLCLTFGCCCIYSLFNVISIVIKQFLNWLIKKLDLQCKFHKGKKSSPSHLGRRFPKPKISKKTTEQDVDSVYDSGSEEGSDEMISTHVKSNKFSLAVLQKQLYETAHHHHHHHHHHHTVVVSQPRTPTGSFTPGTVGPLAIVTQKLEGDSV
ncbi:unnamed protein product [Darwinula stevensoni]|uniref:Potassium channel domain-containing protein n=1 Tax=Darwinula stevensoni TaxID=69355 RepID=A0A7R8X8Q0_9CRUS|nr:unnamed protein product [Darwinula stevensoni]CAG0888936.1 unnamed protein product [Darwinula stevensoni]